MPTRFRILSVLLVVIGGVVGLAACSDGESVDALREAEPGDCVNTPAELNDPWTLVDCDGQADYEVLKAVEEDLPDDAAASVCDDQAYDYGLSLTQGDPFSLCLQQTPREGECIYEGRYLVCEDGGGSKVDAVLTGTTDVAGCGEGAQGRVYEEDETVVCIVPNL